MTIKSDLLEIKRKLGVMLFKFSEAVSSEGITIVYEGELEEKLEVFTYDEAMNKIMLPDGEYNVEGKVITVVEGKIATIVDAPVIEEEVIVEEFKAEEVIVPEVIEQKFNAEDYVTKESFNEISTKLDNVLNLFNDMYKQVETFSAQDVENPLDKKLNKIVKEKKESGGASKYFTV